MHADRQQTRLLAGMLEDKVSALVRPRQADEQRAKAASLCRHLDSNALADGARAHDNDLHHTGGICQCLAAQHCPCPTAESTLLKLATSLPASGDTI